MKFTGLILLLIATSTLAQTPGSWKLVSTVCQLCNEPVAIDFCDTSLGILMVESGEVNSQTLEAPAFTYRSFNGGIDWQVFVDTLPARILGTKYRPIINTIRFLSPNNIIYFFSNAIITSDNGGVKWSFPTNMPFTRGLAAHIVSPSTFFKFTSSDDNTEVSLSASYDSGYFFEQKKVRDIEPGHAIYSVRFIDTNEIWAVAGIHVFAEDTTQPGKLLHTSNGGITWEEFHPNGLLPGVSYFNSHFGHRGIVPGAIKGTVYLLGNVYRYKSPDRKQIDILFSTDGGTEWDIDSTNMGQIYGKTELLYNPTGTQLWSVFEDRTTIAYSPNNGRDWFYDSTSFNKERISFMLWKDFCGYLVTYKDSTIKVYQYTPKPQKVEKTLYFFPRNYYNIYPTIIDGSTVFVNSRKEMKGTFIIYDLLGRKYLNRAVTLNPSTDLPLDIGSLSDGIYILALQTESEVISTRFIKQ